MKFPRLHNFVLTSFLITGCNTQNSLVIERRIMIERNSFYDIQMNYRAAENRGLNSDRSSHLYKTARLFAGNNLPGAPGAIIQKGIQEAVLENFTEAEFLFRELESTLKDGTVQNNIAVLYEASGRYDEAFSMYTTALLVSPDEKIFRTNFSLFLAQNYYGMKEPAKKTRR